MDCSSARQASLSITVSWVQAGLVEGRLSGPWPLLTLGGCGRARDSASSLGDRRLGRACTCRGLLWTVCFCPKRRAALGAQTAKNLPAVWETWVRCWIGKIPWRRKWQPTPIFLPGESHGQRSLVGCRPWGLKESDTTERLTQIHGNKEAVSSWRPGVRPKEGHPGAW